MNQEVRTLVNWLSTRVIWTEQYGVIPDPDRVGERETILRLLVAANAAGVPVVPGVPIPADVPVTFERTDELYCARCDVDYKRSHYHCCVCGRIFRTARAFETHQKVAEPATDAALERLGMYHREDGVWQSSGPMDEEALARLRGTTPSPAV